ncbi:MAG: class I SAM-dependent methyltransferase [Armatimonadota bacterium]
MTDAIQPADLEPGLDFFCGDRADLDAVYAVDGFVFQRCGTCGLVLVNPRLNEQARQGQVYTDAYHAPRGHALPRRALKAAKAALLSPLKPRDRQVRRLRFVERFVQARTVRLLDVGCWTGDFLRRAHELHPDWLLRGLEPSPDAAAAARDRHGLDVLTGSLEEAPLPPQSCDAITMWHVLEHLPDPPAAVARSAELLAPGGFLLLRTPNYDSLYRRLYGRRWRGFLPREHLYIFTYDTLRRLLGEAGLDIVQPRPGPLARWPSSIYVAARKPAQPPVSP